MEQARSGLGRIANRPVHFSFAGHPATNDARQLSRPVIMRQVPNPALNTGAHRRALSPPVGAG